MITFRFCGIEIELHFLFFGILTIFLLIDSSGVSAYGLIASLMHESGHILALAVSGYRPQKISFELSGICLKQNPSPLSPGKEIFILLAGSGVNFSVFALSLLSAGSLQKIDTFAVVHLLLGIVNLLPFLSLDGGKVFLLLLSQCVSILTAEKIAFFLQTVLILGFTLFSVFSVLAGKINFTACILCGYLLAMTFLNEKTESPSRFRPKTKSRKHS